jgi:ribonuclease J
MPVEICTIGGYNEVGKNCTAIRIDDDVIIIDMGLHLEKYIKYTEDEDIININANDLIKVGAVPDISIIQQWKDKVRALIPAHAHLDHIGAIPYLANKFNAPIICTPFTASVIKAILKDEDIQVRNEIKVLNANSKLKINKKVIIEFIGITHSTPQTVMVAIHTKYGIILYANDFKFDRFPTLGKKPNFERLHELGEDGILALIVDSTYAGDAKKMPSESVAKQMLKDVLLGTNSKENLVVITTFSSHLARLKSIIEFGKRLNRRIVFLGRSLAKYVKAGENVDIIKFSEDVKIISFKKEIKKFLKNIGKKRNKYLLVVTGHQGEPKSVLSKMARKELHFKFKAEDQVIFSCKIIPTETHIQNRKVLENELRSDKVRIFKDIHVSGHAAREDLRDLINIIKPKHIIPAHGELQMTKSLEELAIEIGYKKNENVHLMSNGRTIIF